MKSKTIIVPLILVAITTLLVFAFIPSFEYNANADMGPKPSVKIAIQNVPSSTPCYATMLSEAKSHGPHHVREPVDLSEAQPDKLEYTKAFNAFATYSDPDGFYFLGIMSDCSSGRLECNYYPPSVFKVVIYFPESDEFISSAIQETYAFDSYYTLDLQNGEIVASPQDKSEIDIIKSYNYAGEIIALIIRIVLTMGVELLIAWLFRYMQKKKVVTILLTNLVTNIILNIVLYILYYLGGLLTYILIYIFAEGFVFLAEAIVYSVVFRKDTPKSPIIKSIFYALIANVLSFGIGVVLGIYLPSIF